MTVNYRKMSVANGEIRYAHPGDVTHTVTVGVRTAPKTAGPVALTNNRLAYLENFQAPVTNGTVTSSEQNLSIRIQVSGSTQNADVMKAKVLQAFANFTAIMNDKGLEGFMPEITLVAEA